MSEEIKKATILKDCNIRYSDSTNLQPIELAVCGEPKNHRCSDSFCVSDKMERICLFNGDCHYCKIKKLYEVK